MDYTTYPGYEPVYWSQQQQHPTIYSPGPYYSLSSQDERYTQWDLLPSVPDPKDYLFQPQMNTPSAHFIMESSPRELDMHQLTDYDRSVRYVSPTASHHSSSFSESSASTEHAPTPSAMHPSMPYIPSMTPFPGQHTFKLHTVPVPQHTVWQSQTHDSYATIRHHSSFPAFVPSQSSHSMSQLDIVQHDEGDITMIFDNEVDIVHSKSPIHIPQPEELKLSDDQDDSNMSISSPTDNDGTTITARLSSQSNTSDEETEEDEEPIPVDHESDSDYDNRPHRRRTSRSTPRQKHTRRPSANTIISSSSRVHKRKSSSSTVVSSTPTSTPRAHNRRPSKSSKPKPKGPIFVTKTPPSSQDRTFPCTFHRFGCTTEFPNKNEWKRHVACQHLQLGYYRCDLDGCDPDSCSTPSVSRNGRRNAANALSRTQSRTDDRSGAPDEIIKIYNDFNRKDLFTQHCRRMHGPLRNPALCSKPLNKKTGLPTPTKEDEAAFEAQLTEIRTRCWHVRRPAPSRSSCGFCKTVFDRYYYENSTTSSAIGQGKNTENNAEEKAWEERMEHVGRHYEKEGAGREEEEMDEDLVEWGVRTGVLRVLDDGRPWLVSAEDPTGEERTDGTTNDQETGNANTNAAGRGMALGGSVSGKGNGSGNEEEKDRKKARRQPSRTVVREPRVSFEEGDTIVVGGGEVCSG